MSLKACCSNINCTYRLCEVHIYQNAKSKVVKDLKYSQYCKLKRPIRKSARPADHTRTTKF